MSIHKVKQRISRILQQVCAVCNVEYPIRRVKHKEHKGYDDNAKSGVVFMCDGSVMHGGLSDRLRGLMTVFAEAKHHKLPFYIYWTNPFNIDDFLLPCEIDWRISAKELANPSNAYKIYYFRSKNEDENKFGHRKLGLSMLCPRKQLQVYSNADDCVDKYPQLYRQLFIESPELTAALDSHRKKLGSKYQSFSFRFLQLLGDFDDCISEPLTEKDAECLMQKCREELLKLLANMPPGYKALVASDSVRFLHYIKDIDDRIYVVDGKIAHVDLAKETHKCDEVWLKTFVDINLLMGAEIINLLKTGGMYNSGFPRFAAIIGGKPFKLHEF